MIYPNNFENKIGFTEIRQLLKGWCLSTLGKEKVDELSFTDDASQVVERLKQVSELRRLSQQSDGLQLQYFFDVRPALSRIRLEGTHLEEAEVWDVRRSLDTIAQIVRTLRTEDGDAPAYPALFRLTEGVETFPAIIRRIDSILDKFGHIKDSASMTLAGIRHELTKMEGSISRTLYTILHSAQREGLVDKDAAPTVRDGRLVIPVAPGLKRRIGGIVHDESATGKTVFIEPTEVVEANNRIRQLEAEERREVIRILSVFTDELRPHLPALLSSYQFLAMVDLIHAKAEWAEQMGAIEPTVDSRPHIDWIGAIHPLLALSLRKQGKRVVPLDILLTNDPEPGAEKRQGRLLIISGPNAGGKSVCLKTVGLLQYMLQCGLSVPIGERSSCGVFGDIMIDIGDEQSIEDDLSTYSSHLMNMKQMMRQSSQHTLLLIDEFGGGTEPTIGGAIAEAVLRQLWKSQAFGVITTHYQNLKHFADDHEGVCNGAMLYDRNQMQALFQLSIGQPGSSFAIEIARKTGIPEEVISDASAIVGADYIQSDKYLQDIVRDKRYWEGKRQTIHQREKSLENKISRYEDELSDIQQQRKLILQQAREQAEELLRQSNRKIENAIREIRESQAEKEAARRIREDLNAFRSELSTTDSSANDEQIARKMRQIEERRARRDKRRQEKQARSKAATSVPDGFAAEKPEQALSVGTSVRIKGLQSVGTIEAIDGKMATVIFGGMKTKMRLERLELATEATAVKGKAEERHAAIAGGYGQVSVETRQVIDSRKLNFRQDLDVRGMRGDEALNAVTYFIDDAILVGMPRVRILHGTGTGILRQLIRQYLATIPNVKSFRDEHVQFGGAGITVVDMD